jgi:hypothetical protein
MPSSLFQIVNSLFQSCYNNWEQVVRTQLVDNLWTDILTTCLQTCNNLCVFTCELDKITALLQLVDKLATSLLRTHLVDKLWDSYMCTLNIMVLTIFEIVSHAAVAASPRSLYWLWVQNRDNTEARLLGFSYDFGVTRNSSSNADAMVLASTLMRGIHPPDNIQNDGCPGGEYLSWRQHLDDESCMSWQRLRFLAGSTFCVSLFCD